MRPVLDPDERLLAASSDRGKRDRIVDLDSAGDRHVAVDLDPAVRPADGTGLIGIRFPARQIVLLAVDDARGADIDELVRHISLRVFVPGEASPW